MPCRGVDSLRLASDMDLLLLGGSGQLGTELQRVPLEADVQIVAPTREQFDITSDGDIGKWLAARRWNVVINAAAYTAVDRAEAEEEIALAMNARAPSRLAAQANRYGIPLIQVSTDYVFDGRKGRPYLPDDAISPINVYGTSKALGERAVRTNNPRHVILRTSWLYSPFRKNFMKTMLRIGARRDGLKVVDDQWGCPTAAHDLAEVCAAIARRVSLNPDGVPYGTYHVAGYGGTTWCGFARAIFDLARPRLRKVPLVDGIATADYPTPAKRPIDSRLDCTSSSNQWGFVMRDWRIALEDTLARYLAEEPA